MTGPASNLTYVLFVLAFPFFLIGSSCFARQHPAETVEPDLPLYVTGTAESLENGNVLYVERHYCAPSGDLCEVLYTSPQGRAIAHKVIDYSMSKTAPGIVMRDLLRAEEQAVTPEQAGDVVVDAGFDHYVRSQWAPLVNGESVEFSFRMLGVSRPVTMQARSLAADGCFKGSLCLQVELKSWFLGLLADPIRLQYDVETRRLQEFAGVSNIKTPKGRSQSVRIRYEYPSALSDSS